MEGNRRTADKKWNREKESKRAREQLGWMTSQRGGSSTHAHTQGESNASETLSLRLNLGVTSFTCPPGVAALRQDGSVCSERKREKERERKMTS